MTSIADLCPILQTLLSTTADAAAADTGFVQRKRKLTGAAFVQLLVFGLLGTPEATLEALVQAAADVAVGVSAQAIDLRFTRQAADCVKQVLEAAVTQLVSSDPVCLAVLARFARVSVVDSTIIGLPAAFEALWPGCGGSTPKAGAAALKVLVRLDLLTGTLEAFDLHAGRVHDRRAEQETAPLHPAALDLADLGFFALERLAELQAQGTHFLSRPGQQTTIVDGEGRAWTVRQFLAAQPGTAIDVAVRLGKSQRLPCRLVAVRVPLPVADERRRKLRAEAQREGATPSADALALTAWTVYVTSVPQDQLSLREILALYRLRWQIELLFKLWKSHGKLADCRSQKPARILTEVYAKLLALLVQHWLLVTSCWQYPDKSLVKAAAAIRRWVPALARAFATPQRFQAELTALAARLTHGCRLNPRRAHPNAYQLLLAFTDEPELAEVA